MVLVLPPCKEIRTPETCTRLTFWAARGADTHMAARASIMVFMYLMGA